MTYTNKKLHRISSRKTDGKWGFREVIDILDNWLYHQVATSIRKRYNSDSIW